MTLFLTGFLCVRPGINGEGQSYGFSWSKRQQEHLGPHLRVCGRVLRALTIIRRALTPDVPPILSGTVENGPEGFWGYLKRKLVLKGESYGKSCICIAMNISCDIAFRKERNKVKMRRILILSEREVGSCIATIPI